MDIGLGHFGFDWNYPIQIEFVLFPISLYSDYK